MFVGEIEKNKYIAVGKIPFLRVIGRYHKKQRLKSFYGTLLIMVCVWGVSNYIAVCFPLSQVDTP